MAIARRTRIRRGALSPGGGACLAHEVEPAQDYDRPAEENESLRVDLDSAARDGSRRSCSPPRCRWSKRQLLHDRLVGPSRRPSSVETGVS